MTKIRKGQPITWTDAISLVWRVAPSLAQTISAQLQVDGEDSCGSPILINLKYRESLPPLPPYPELGVLLVVRGLLEVLEGDSTERFPRYIARSGALVGAFEFLNDRVNSPYELTPGSKFGFEFPKPTNPGYLRWLAGATSIEEGDLSLADAIGARLRTALKEDYVQLLVLPAKLFARVNHRPEGVTYCRTFLLESTIVDYQHALSRARADHYRFRPAKPTRPEIEALVQSNFIEHEIVWLPIDRWHQLPTVLGLSKEEPPQLKDAVDRLNRIRLVRHKGGKEAGVLFLPTVFGWHDVSWGLIPASAGSVFDTFLTNLGAVSWRAQTDELGNCIITCDKAYDFVRPPNKRMECLSQLMRSVFDTTLTDCEFIEGNGLLKAGLAKNFRGNAKLTFAFKSSFFVDRLLSVAKRRLRGTDCDLIGVQHLLRCIHELSLQCLRTRAVKSVTLRGKAYSTSDEVKWAMRHDGIEVDGFSHEGNQELADVQVRIGQWDDALQAMVSRMIDALVPGRYLIVDDGGALLERANSMHDEITRCRDISIAAGVELTTSGIKKMSNLSTLRFPIVNVAQSWAKQRLESPLIAMALSKRTAGVVEGEIFRGARILVLGSNGALGKSVHRRLILAHPTENIEALDQVDPAAMLDAVCKNDIVLGCTGRDVFAGLDQNLIRSRFLQRFLTKESPLNFISCSSGDIEFCALLKMSDQYEQLIHEFPAPDVVLSGSLVKSKDNATVAVIRRSGFPINFDNKRDSVPLPDIRLTTSLLACGIVQALVIDAMLTESEPRIYALHPRLQAIAVRHWILSTTTRRKASQSYSPQDSSEIEEFVLKNIAILAADAAAHHQRYPEFGAAMPDVANKAVEEIAQDVWDFVDALYVEGAKYHGR